ncbi:hypothetical protein KL86SPO_30801 [uncultured Sporomusa sp.]|uniref:Uncharacterized protein n=1 Tax=uncultured Sporomusa sp. TaxID=307249 RepID=A0A212LSR9_9FIRM|nr:hypothetical protein [uncultured Sporomusa sp.]SCM80623.1 hypothetical protein KL86SPO_30801 [uncultured Sporomusa sp.]
MGGTDDIVLSEEELKEIEELLLQLPDIIEELEQHIPKPKA